MAGHKSSMDGGEENADETGPIKYICGGTVPGVPVHVLTCPPPQIAARSTRSRHATPSAAVPAATASSTRPAPRDVSPRTA